MRLLHTMVRVGDMQRSIDFYTNVMGMQLLRTTDRPDQKYSLAFVGYADESQQAVIELTYNYGVTSYELGTGFGHIAVGVDDIYGVCERVKASQAAKCRASRGQSKVARRSSRSSRIRMDTRSN